ncbi:MAG: hypothetical protein IJS29_10555 [Selenomonadaceae bacterium]|nr:hypothetical protein [Selenomonadaceae bacterium]
MIIFKFFLRRFIPTAKAGGFHGAFTVSADTSSAAQFSLSSNRVISNSNSLLIKNGSTATLDGYQITGTSNGYSFALQEDSFTLNNVSYSGAGTATFTTGGNASVTSGAILNGTSNATVNLAAGNYTLNGAEVTTAANNTATLSSSGAQFKLSTNAVTYNSMTFTGAGTATFGDSIILTGGAAVASVAADQSFTFSGSGAYKLNNKTIVSSATSLTVTNTADGLTIGENTFSVTGDDEYRINVDASGNIISAAGINGGATIVDAGGADSILTSSAGNFTFAQDNNKVFAIGGDDSVTFGLSEDGAVTKIADVVGTIGGNFTSAININGNAADVLIEGDDSVIVTAESSGAAAIGGVSNNASIKSTGGAKTVTTDEEGTFHFYDAQNFSISGDNSVDFTVGEIVSGVTNFENGTLQLDNASQLAINAEKLTMQFTDTATFIIADSKVVSVDSVETSINGLTSDVTVHAANVMTVNNVYANVHG